MRFDSPTRVRIDAKLATATIGVAMLATLLVASPAARAQSEAEPDHARATVGQPSPRAAENTRDTEDTSDTGERLDDSEPEAPSVTGPASKHEATAIREPADADHRNPNQRGTEGDRTRSDKRGLVSPGIDAEESSSVCDDQTPLALSNTVDGAENSFRWAVDYALTNGCDTVYLESAADGATGQHQLTTCEQMMVDAPLTIRAFGIASGDQRPTLSTGCHTGIIRATTGDFHIIDLIVEGPGGPIVDDSTSLFHSVCVGCELTATNSHFYNGRASVDGGALAGHQVTVTDSVFDANHSTRHGGAIRAIGHMAINSSTFTDNRSRDGGAVMTKATATILDSHLTNNHASHYGGAVYGANNVQIRRTVIDSNSADHGGGLAALGLEVVIRDSEFRDNQGTYSTAIWAAHVAINATTVVAPGPSLSPLISLLFEGNLTNSTIVGNNAPIFRFGASGGVTPDIVLRHTTIVGSSNLYSIGPLNVTTQASYIDATGAACAVSLGDNYVVQGSCVDTIASDQTGAALELGELGDFGGFTPTFETVPVELVDSIAAPDCTLDDDQRHAPRPQGTGCDIGAVESPIVIRPTVVCQLDVIESSPGSVTIELSIEGSVVPAGIATVLWTLDGETIAEGSPTQTTVELIAGGFAAITATVIDNLGNSYNAECPSLHIPPVHPDCWATPVGQAPGQKLLMLTLNTDELPSAPQSITWHTATGDPVDLDPTLGSGPNFDFGWVQNLGPNHLDVTIQVTIVGADGSTVTIDCGKTTIPPLGSLDCVLPANLRLADYNIIWAQSGQPTEGTNGNDFIIGTGTGDYIDGNDGSDLICGLGGNDLLTGGNGDDWIDGGDRIDEIRGDNGNDRLYGGDGRDTLIGGEGDFTDRCYINPGPDFHDSCEIVV